MDGGPIFIGGLAHSGKTPLRLMLSGHPNLAFTRRTYMWRRFYMRYGDLSQPDNFERCLRAMLDHKPMSVLQPDPTRIRREFRQGPPTYDRLFALFHEHNAARLGKGRWGDQLGMVEQYAKPIFDAYPTAVLIHMVRDPRTRYATVVDRGRTRRGKVGVETARWLTSVELALENGRRFPDRYRIVRYETLFAEPEGTVCELCAFIGEEFVPDMLSGPDAMLNGDAPVPSELLRQGWIDVAQRHQLCGKLGYSDLAFIQDQARQQMQALDYAPQPLCSTTRERLLYNCVDRPANLLSMVAWPRFASQWRIGNQCKKTRFSWQAWNAAEQA